MLRYLPVLLVLALWIHAFVDCLNTPEEEVRHLPKGVWLLVVLLSGWMLVGPVAWLVAGRVRQSAAANGGTAAGRGPDSGWVAPDDNPEFLKSLERDDPGSG
ncbi:PLDc N-terminal domain-containing protein [Streptomyces cellostaticus]|uniref:PLDc N-terminal domain-containing protein n=1 Tax=Streptomyces TaxID=1883 RepID=UPI00202726B7|nr:PLDc N-terminal domain-containing protein [Streptomyces cellostaticus]